MAEENTDATIEDLNTKSEELRKAIGVALYSKIGSPKFSTYQNAIFGLDNTRNTLYMPEMEGHGFTFITRPKLNLSNPSILTDRILSLLNTMEPNTIAFAIRCMLDTKFKSLYNISVSKSQYFNPLNPFISILSNRLISLNGWPDPTLDVETTEGGFFSESITYPKGHDQLTRNYDISATFSDVQGSIVHIIFLMWVRWISLVTRGKVSAYMEDIEARRMCFTSSIYRFVMDPSNRFITKWAKATGCFPRSVPTGAYFNYDANASNVDVAMNLSIPLTVAGKVEYMDPIILKEFNMLMEKNSPNLKSLQPASPDFRMLLNFKCLPYIDLSGNELKWMYDSSDPDIRNIIKNVTV